MGARLGTRFFTDLFVARRIEARGVMVGIAVATTAAAMAVMIVAVAVIMGFRGEITSKITLFTGHITVVVPFEDAGVRAAIEGVPGVMSVAPVGMLTGLAKTADATQGVVLKGVADSLGGRDVVISTELARLLRLDVGDKLEMLFVADTDTGAGLGAGAGEGAGAGAGSGEGAGAGGFRFGGRRALFRVAGLYSSGIGEMDKRMIFAGLRNTEFAGYEVVIDDIANLDQRVGAIAETLRNRPDTPPGTMIRTVVGDYPQLFDWLATHDVNAAVIIMIMVVVALVSMISALLVMVLERIRMVGILKTLGMRSSSLRRIFVLRAARIVLVGVLVGDVLGLGMALAQKHLSLVKLDSEGYFLSTVPISLGWWWIAALSVGVLVVLPALLIVPTTIVGRITPEQSIRYE